MLHNSYNMSQFHLLQRTKYSNLTAIIFRKLLRKYICLVQGEVIKYLLKYKIRGKNFCSNLFS